MLKPYKRWNISRPRCATSGWWKRSLELQTFLQAGCRSMRSASDGQQNLVGATCCSPAMRTPMHGILPCSTTPTSSQHELYQIRPSAIGSTPPFPCDSMSPCFDDFARSDSFDFFDFSTLLLSNGSYLTFCSPNFYRPPLVARYALFDTPEPLITSVLCGCCRLLSLSPNPNFGEQILALRSSAAHPRSTPAASHLFLLTTTNATDVMQLPTIDGRQD